MAVTGIAAADSTAYQKMAQRRANSLQAEKESGKDTFGHQILSQELKEIGMLNQEEYLACAGRMKATLKSEGNLIDSDVMSKQVETEKKAPYSYLADESNMIVYNGVAFYCDNEHQALCLGDMSDEDNVLIIPLSEGGCLKVNRDNISDLSRAISMFSPEDINRILSAIEQDKVCAGRMLEIDELRNSIGEAGEAGSAGSNT